MAPAQAASAPRIREASFDDYPEIAALLARNGLKARSFDDWAGLWRGNPVYERRGGPLGWVLETPDGGLVGTIGNIPGAYRFQGRELISASASDWAVDQSYRRYSLALLDLLNRQPGVDLLLCSTVSAASEPAYPPFRWSRVPAGCWNSSDFWITNYTGFSKAVSKMRGLPMPDMASYPVSAALFCLDRLGRSAGAQKTAVAIQPCTEVDGRFDEFWGQLEREQPNILLAVRTRETLAWHFRRMLRNKGGWLLACSVHGHMVGYATFERHDNPARSLTRVLTTDFQALRGHEPALQSAFRWMLRKCHQDRIDVIENPGCWLDLAGVPRLRAARRRTLPSWSFYYRALDRSLGEELKDSRVWRPSLFDGDVSL
jgi:hypothetical protein